MGEGSPQQSPRAKKASKKKHNTKKHNSFSRCAILSPTLRACRGAMCFCVPFCKKRAHKSTAALSFFALRWFKIESVTPKKQASALKKHTRACRARHAKAKHKCCCFSLVLSLALTPGWWPAQGNALAFSSSSQTKTKDRVEARQPRAPDALRGGGEGKHARLRRRGGAKNV